MPATDLLDPTHVYQVTVYACVYDQAFISTFHYIPGWDPNVPVPNTLTVGSLFQAFITAYRANVLTFLSARYSVIYYQIRDIETREVVNPGPPAEYKLRIPTILTQFGQSPTDDGSLADTFELLPLFNVVNISEFTQVGGRGGSGSWRVGPVLETQQVDGFLTGAAITTYENIMLMAVDELVPIMGFPLYPAIFWRKRYLTVQGGPFAPVEYARRVISAAVNPRIRSLDSRRGRARGCG